MTKKDSSVEANFAAEEIYFMPEFSMSDAVKALQRIQSPMPPLSAIPRRDYNLADYSYEVIMERIKDFEDQLDDEHEVALKLASFGQTVTLSVTDIGYSNPNTLVFHGYVGDQPATLLQHMSQLNFLLIAVRKADPEKPPRRIGFNAGQEEQ